MFHNPKSKFIALDGPDMSGKTTVTKLLMSELAHRNVTPLLLSFANPGGTSLGQTLRRLVKDATIKIEPITAFYLFAAAHTDLAYTIKAHLDVGATVIVDRWWPSTYAYQGLCGIPPAHVVDVIEQFEQIVIPDHMFYLRCSNETAMKRALDDQRVNDVVKDRFEEKGLAFREKLLAVYDRLSDLGRLQRIDTDDKTSLQVAYHIIREVYGA